MWKFSFHKHTIGLNKLFIITLLPIIFYTQLKIYFTFFLFVNLNFRLTELLWKYFWAFHWFICSWIFSLIRIPRLYKKFLFILLTCSKTFDWINRCSSITKIWKRSALHRWLLRYKNHLKESLFNFPKLEIEIKKTMEI